ncbi:hypothetical protein K474DRAFT_1366141 [Panus rudis PR-1116 ss-1]|nr:hypothetical protein K474DRAFT_1366141 [Panus rudis PR-1116 ss-1]
MAGASKSLTWNMRVIYRVHCRVRPTVMQRQRQALFSSVLSPHATAASTLIRFRRVVHLVRLCCFVDSLRVYWAILTIAFLRPARIL